MAKLWCLIFEPPCNLFSDRVYLSDCKSSLLHSIGCAFCNIMHRVSCLGRAVIILMPKWTSFVKTIYLSKLR